MAVMAIMGALGIAGTIVFGLLGLSQGEGNHLAQIYAVTCLFMALGAVVGFWAQRSDRRLGVTVAHA